MSGLDKIAVIDSVALKLSGQGAFSDSNGLSNFLLGVLLSIKGFNAGIVAPESAACIPWFEKLVSECDSYEMYQQLAHIQNISQLHLLY